MVWCWERGERWINGKDDQARVTCQRWSEGRHGGSDASVSGGWAVLMERQGRGSTGNGVSREGRVRVMEPKPRRRHRYAQRWEGAGGGMNDGREGAGVGVNGGCAGPNGVRVPTAGREPAGIIDHDSEHGVKWWAWVWLGLSTTADILGSGDGSMRHVPWCRTVPYLAGAMDSWAC
jgi:hypothetical protein